ncbi:esterase/lipase family protein [Salinibacterium soli]|uniref:Alpha/beta hydrolase n=1 Tax=Antiquaquibacter soli TaxID=3064523 RepID=A0ABT9BMP6_9MICO|nr:alpha/beta hydrolase [Protaetiibacter sp. WY-16]MDO7882239.1 alpha/beta hydrolase [Protaetiibacter sp. WY-16]
MTRYWLWSLDYWYVAWHQWRALFIRRVPDSFSNGDSAPVLLIAGVWEPWYFLRGVGRRLNRAGHPVHVAREIGYNRASVADVAAIAGDYLDAHGLEHVVVVAHSKGGLVGKRLLAHPRVERLIAIATPFSGSVYANYLPGRALREFRPSNDALLELAADVASNARIVSIYPAFDPHIPGGSALEGAVNIEIPTTGHFRILSDERVLRAIETALE